MLCTICLNTDQPDSILIEIQHCKHIFHLTCLAIWCNKNYTCPNCRQFVYITDWLYNITNKARSERNIAFYMYIKNRLSNVILSKPIKTYLLQDLQSKKYLFNQYNTALKLSSY